MRIGEEHPFPAAAQQMEQHGGTVLLPQTRFGFSLMPGQRFQERAVEVGRMPRPEILQGSALGGRLDFDQAVPGIDALG